MKRFFLRVAQTNIGITAVVLLALVGTATTVQAQEKSGAKSDTSAKPAEASSTGNVDNGKKLFMANGCFECHGTVGQGSTSTGGVRIGPPAISLDGMIQYLRHPSGQMPPYTDKVISDQNLTDIYAYLKAQPKPQSGKSIPLLNQ
jgi:mono/diheme cytochrome c family protein